MSRDDVWFGSGKEQCAGWFYPAPSGDGNAPAVVLGIGLGSVKEMGLDRYARVFQEHGFAALAFDYRSFGSSTGEPRQVIDVSAQLNDWRRAIEFVRTLPGVDADRVVVWGTSFGGGHALSLAAEAPDGVVAAVAQCPFTDGVSSALAMSPLSAIRVGRRAIRDVLAERRGRAPVMVPTAAALHQAGLMTSDDAVPGFLSLVPDEARDVFVNETAARIGLRIMKYRPGKQARRMRMPVFAAVCLRDTVAPPRATLRHLRRAPGAEVTTYDTGHFAIYRDPWFGPVVSDQLEFLKRHVLDA